MIVILSDPFDRLRINSGSEARPEPGRRESPREARETFRFTHTVPVSFGRVTWMENCDTDSVGYPT